MTQTASDATTPLGRLDPEDAQLALATVQEVLHRHALVENLVHRQEQNDSRSDLVEGLLHRQHEAELSALVNGLHPADIATHCDVLSNIRSAVLRVNVVAFNRIF